MGLAGGLAIEVDLQRQVLMTGVDLPCLSAPNNRKRQ